MPGIPVVPQQFIGKTGADAVARRIGEICRTIKRYHAQLIAIVTIAQTLGAITSTQRDACLAFIDGVDGLCDAFKAVANISGVK